jgi:adenylate cyclase
MQSFFALIDRLNAVPPDEREPLKELIWNAFGTERAVLALDMSDFSLSVRRTGILNHLRRIRSMQTQTEPIVREHGGQPLKYEADNLLAVFDEVGDAVAAAVRINRESIPPDSQGERMGFAIGIDFGRILLIPGKDCFGDAVNTACKLGEDIAQRGEILLTSAARARLPETGASYRLDEQQVSFSGIALGAYAVRY